MNYWCLVGNGQEARGKPPFIPRAVSFSRKKKEREIGGEGDGGIFVHKVLTNRKKSLYLLLLLNLS
ncbi:hypothetical protein CSQ80_01970 [Cyanobacterium aponinum IPPAS B-1201]|nr:hypothetical protein CSQ80_01970 [Cyanobacterium aponinum IPPAS B-1201]